MRLLCGWEPYCAEATEAGSASSARAETIRRMRNTSWGGDGGASASGRETGLVARRAWLEGNVAPGDPVGKAIFVMRRQEVPALPARQREAAELGHARHHDHA